MKTALTWEQALTRLMDQCSRSETCTSEAVTKLYRWLVDPNDHDKVIQALIDSRYIDDQRYANAYTRDKAAFSQWGALKINAALLAKRIKKEFIANALAQLDTQEQDKTMRQILEKKIRQTKAKDNNDLYTKMIRFGLSRGFEYPKVSKIAKQLIFENEDD